MAGKSQAPQSGSCQYRSINEHLEIHADIMRNPGVGVSGSLHLTAGAEIREASLDTLTTQDPLPGGFLCNL